MGRVSTLPAEGGLSGPYADPSLNYQCSWPAVNFMSGNYATPSPVGSSGLDLSDPMVLLGYYNDVSGGNSYASVDVRPGLTMLGVSPRSAKGTHGNLHNSQMNLASWT